MSSARGKPQNNIKMNMTEKPILFRAPMVRAILDGRKTQTRQILKFQPKNVKRVFIKNAKNDVAYVENEYGVEIPLCAFPYGKVGNRLWVRETYRMPRRESRISLEITDIRVERLQDISEADAKAEGAQKFDNIPMGRPTHCPNRWSMENPKNTDQCLFSARYAFGNYFEKINGPYAWDLNPWVWVIEFKQVQL